MSFRPTFVLPVLAFTSSILFPARAAGSSLFGLSAETPSPALARLFRRKERPAGEPAPQNKVYHQPLFLDAVAVPNYRHGLALRLDMGVDRYHPQDGDPDVLDALYTRVKIMADYRYAPNQRAEIFFKAPFVVQTLEYSGSAGERVRGESSSGMGQGTVGFKVPFSRTAGFALFTEPATGRPGADLPLGEGDNFGGVLLAHTGRWHFGLGHVLKTEYDRQTARRSLRRDPGDVTHFSLARTERDRMDYPHDDYVGLVYEARYFLVGKDRVDGRIVQGTDGAAADLSAGFVVGKVGWRSWHATRLAAVLGLGPESHQNFDLARGTGDFHLLLSHEVRWGRMEW